MRHGLFRVVAATAMVVTLSGAALAADGDVARGEKVFKKCKACHSLEAGQNKVGPTLAGVFGRQAGTLDGFKFSKAMVGLDIVWDDSSLDKLLANPKGFIPGIKMAFPGLKKEADRIDVISYLNQAAK